MARIERFEDIESWKLAREIAGEIYAISSNGEFARDFALRDQIRRAAIAILSNIAEGFEREGNKEFINFLFVAKASCAEARSQLYIALDQNYIDREQFERIYGKLDETGRVIGGLVRYLSNSDFKGSKFR
ncbi:MAG: four helix bundle protein [Pyrinomonadaceae bacterium]